MVRLFLCVGLFAFGYYVGRKSSRQASIQAEMGWERSDREEIDF